MVTKPFIHVASNRKYVRLSDSYRLGRLHRGTAYAAGSVRACVFMPRVGRGRRLAGQQCVRRRGTHIYHQTEAQRRGSLLKQTRREYPVWQRTFEYSAQIRGEPAGK